jgi:hypothetical protein
MVHQIDEKQSPKSYSDRNSPKEEQIHNEWLN